MAKYKLKIDPGHGGKDPGAISKFGHEEDWTLKISLYQYNRFKELGVSVSLTRDSYTTLTEDQRVALAQEGEYCLSNHLNAGGGDRAEVVHSIYDDGKLANAIKAQLLAVGQQAVKVYCKQGKSGDYYYMHRRTGKTKTNIVEYCFIDNEADFTHFKNNWEAYAEATVKSFCSHIGHPYKSKNTEPAPQQTVSKIEPYFFSAPNGPIARARVIADGAKIYTAPNSAADFVRTAIKGEEFDIYTNLNDWHNVGGANWIKGNQNGVQQLALIVFKVIVDNLQYGQARDLVPELQKRFSGNNVWGEPK
jgi:N-acetylmuramoyl-L-alanine amidase